MMNSEQFFYWLQGRAEMQPTNPPSAEEWAMICEHLQSVFRKDPSPAFVPQLPPMTMHGLGNWQTNPFETPQCGRMTAQFGRNEPNTC